jgi:hypothetical protein
MTSGGQGAAPRSARRVAGRPAYPGRLTVRPPPSLSRRERFTRSLGKAFYWQGWKTVAAVAASLVAIATAGVAIQTFRVSQQTLGVSEQALHANTRQQTSDRFVKAIEQLGNDKLNIRLGGIYGLEQLARDSPSEHPTAYEILETFVRDNAPLGKGMCAIPGTTIAPDVPPADIQAAISVISRRDRKNEASDRVVDLSESCLLLTNFADDQFPGISLVGSDLRIAYLVSSHLAGADLLYTNLKEANLEQADLRGANLRQSNLAGALLSGSQLDGAFLQNADLSGADLRGADLTGADLTADPSAKVPRGTNLTGANLSGANLADICYYASTQWPEGFQPPPSRPRRTG